ncbi:pyrroline-5-carboxylate reductase family protein [Aureimonas psammosilenae]|uniref:pyrroline-5-carboxylate reductase family protein n=1 Tax=Aureimonas psammosilenae TaxID=2495496 RepID=UPI001260F01D|nr:pyrroline-5-carboxylate reductase dimerization domain-containing protein [Aureimonas psammosilenae]
MTRTLNETIGIVGGEGWLGNAIASAAVESGTVDPSRLTVSGRGKRGALPIGNAHRTIDNAELAARSDVIVLSVRPDQFGDIDIDAAGKLVISVMAGVPARAIAERTGAAQVVRSIPNAAAAIKRSFTPWFALETVTPENRALVQQLFESCGTAAEVSDESHIDYCAGMTGTGAAFPALLAEALVAHAVSQGLPRPFAEKAARSLLTDASQLFAGPDGDTARIVKEMIDYRGMTAAALQTMLDQGFNQAVGAGLDAGLAKGAAMAAG